MVLHTVEVLLLCLFFIVHLSCGVELDAINCGTDHEADVYVGNVSITQYPWMGILYYSNYDETGESRAVTMVVLVHKEFVLAPGDDIFQMPKHDFRENSRVLLAQDWRDDGMRVRSYVIHPEHGQTVNTIALVQLAEAIVDNKNLYKVPIKPLCPPPDMLRDPEFYIVKFDSDYNNLQKRVYAAEHVPAKMCKDFYVSTNLYMKRMRPVHVACALAVEEGGVCVWDAGAALVARDVWGRWQLLGLGVRGPGCMAPARFLDMMSYYPWVEVSLRKFQRLTISKISKQKYVLRSSSQEVDENGAMFMRYGACDPEEKKRLVYRETIVLRTDNNLYQFMTYNMTILGAIEYTCLTLEIVNGSSVSEMRVQHYCPRRSHGPVCYHYRRSSFDISVFIMFSDKCLFEMFAWGEERNNFTLLPIQESKWDEGEDYEDFSMTRVEYRGTQDQTEFGFEPVDEKLWVPEYDIWTTTIFDNMSVTTSSSRDTSGTEPPDKDMPTYTGRDATFPPEQATETPDQEFLLGIRW